MEVFLPIKDFKDYDISNYGRVFSHKTSKILKNHLLRNGYYQIYLSNNGKVYPITIHRLVAEAFIPNPLGLPCVNHKNEIKTDNRVFLELDSEDNVVVNYEKSNLEWCSHKYNSNYGTIKERIGEKNAISQKGKKLSEETKRKLSQSHINNPLKSKPVVAVDMDDNVVMEFPSTAEAGRQGFSQRHVWACCKGLRNKHGGYRWFYKDEWLEMQKNKAKPVKRELPYQLSLQFD